MKGVEAERVFADFYQDIWHQVRDEMMGFLSGAIVDPTITKITEPDGKIHSFEMILTFQLFQMMQKHQRFSIEFS